jgi:hypothetical protein
MPIARIFTNGFANHFTNDFPNSRRPHGKRKQALKRAFAICKPTSAVSWRCHAIQLARIPIAAREKEKIGGVQQC